MHNPQRRQAADGWGTESPRFQGTGVVLIPPRSLNPLTFHLKSSGIPAIQAYLKPEKPADEEGINMLEVLGIALNKLEAEGRSVQPKREEGLIPL